MFLFCVFNDNIIDNEESGGIFLLTLLLMNFQDYFYIDVKIDFTIFSIKHSRSA